MRTPKLAIHMLPTMLPRPFRMGEGRGEGSIFTSHILPRPFRTGEGRGLSRHSVLATADEGSLYSALLSHQTP
jgi:hypothetical protein